jgi:hypothetical protein
VTCCITAILQYNVKLSGDCLHHFKLRIFITTGCLSKGIKGTQFAKKNNLQVLYIFTKSDVSMFNCVHVKCHLLRNCAFIYSHFIYLITMFQFHSLWIRDFEGSKDGFIES